MVTGIDKDKINADFRGAQALHQAGDVHGAAMRYEALQPKLTDHPELLYLLGAAYVQLERLDDAVPLLERSLALRPIHIPALEMAGSAWIKMQEPTKALAYFREAARLNPGAIDAACRLGATLAACDQFDEALEAFQRALAIDSNHAEAMTGKAFALHRTGQSAEAETDLRRCIGMNPAYAQGYATLAALLADTERLAEAENVLRQCLQACPKHPSAQHDLAIVLHRQGRLPEAEQAYHEAIALGVTNTTIFVQLCDALADLGRLDEAETLLNRALLKAPKYAGLLTGLGRIEELRGNLEKALAFHNRAIAADENYAESFINRGNAWKFYGDFSRALADYDSALALNPNLPAATGNRGMTLLTLGKLSEGWRAFKARIKARVGSIDLSGSTAWDGSPLDGKNVLVWTEYGLGDEIMFAGLLPELVAKVAHCTLVCSPRLVTVFNRTFPDVTVQALGEPIDGEFDARLPLTDAAQWLRPSMESFPTHAGYIRANAEHVDHLRKRYQQSGDEPLVGISWYSGGGIGTAPFKSIALEQWAPILNVPNIKFVSLQYGDCENEIRAIKENIDRDIILDSEIETSGDMDSFTAQVAAMDLVISVSNTTVHFAGALGKPAWALVPKGPGAHWYWFQDRTDSVWYPSLRIFRQPNRGQWREPINQVASQLEHWARR
jgi:tetratricopeptide (TPR) repeat protein